MVWINTQCENRSATPGTFGGARCVCPKCQEKRSEMAGGCNEHSSEWQYWQAGQCHCLGCERAAFRYLLRKLKSHHRTKPGITTLIKKTEEMAGI